MGEALLIGLAGAALGGIIACLAFDRQSITTMGASSDSVITSRAVFSGMLIAVLIDLLESLVRAVRATT
ncbi:hypothetical protein CA233_09535 [Sphingomonas sp. ABOLD]|uniref:Uncharacterized protein n=1 Tax=Sphingomonas trueperi TaxID=53317 RepID=A0A7X5Y2C7_9SPHN|nr:MULTISPECIES: hypothetical protein [Sphingomonas]NJB99340.1 hypothetical protein [Sphingomonas trueperi]RSV40651.1 hypothetical protein CA234_11115 [Sphingomonas sp. ABOLE]RSV48541.1 hypothetical protein CA233_09535 [Sphingomonas sp. ABOLD]